MDTFKAIAERRSIKHYDPNHIIPTAIVNRLMESALLSPTSFNMQNWRFVIVSNSKTKQAIRKAAWNQAQCSEASIVILLCADLDAHKDPQRYWVNAPKETSNALVPMITSFYQNKPQLQNDEAMRSIGIAAQTLMLGAKAMGYDSCPMIGFDRNKVGEIINLPKNHLIGMMLTIGKAIKPANKRGGQLAYNQVVFNESFSHQ